MAPLTPRKRPIQSRSRSTVEAILEATAQVLETEGPSGFTTNAVARRAGVSIGTLYQYFPDKHALVAALSRGHRASLVQLLEEAMERGRGLAMEDGLRLLVEAALSADVDRPRFGRILDLLEAHLPLDAEDRTTKAHIGAIIANFLRAHFDADETILQEAAEQLRAVTEALADGMLERHSSSSPVSIVERISRVLLAMLPAILIYGVSHRPSAFRV